jgi:hypothetical protein
MPAHPRPIVFTRFWSKVNLTPNGCWLWTGRTTNTGYGEHGNQLAHRIAWEWAAQESIPDGKVIDHLCRNPLCVRPDHLEPVSQQINTQRGLAWNHDDRCKWGHALTPENVYLTPSRGRRCRKCHAIRERDRHRRKRAAEKQATAES